jgi:hypothetical protein
MLVGQAPGGAFVSSGPTLADLFAPLAESMRGMNNLFAAAVESLAPTFAKIAEIGNSFARLMIRQHEFGKCLYRAVLAFLERLPGGAFLANALRAFVGPKFDLNEFLRKRAHSACGSGTPPSRITSPRRLVSQGNRTLRGPSRALAPYLQIGEPALI